MQALAPHVPADEMAALSLRFDANRSVVQSSRLFATVPASARLIEGVAWDPGAGGCSPPRWSAASCSMATGGPGGRCRGFNPGSLFGIAVDDARRLLWVASGSSSSRRRRRTPPFAA